ncbi:MAG: hypothetical protein DRP45_12450 [Candidatus Zixiibacteriota bacterium]|nr:MAG: hypothetical protein DRP45_12450 [candidate division Zixibacteria bacterium]
MTKPSGAGVLKILSVDSDSPLSGQVCPGFKLISINGEKVRDAIDFQFKLAEDHVNILFADPQGNEVVFQFEDISTAELGLTLEDHKVIQCNNDCIFCFVDQQPKGMRPALYVRDEDFRLSFTHGNYITLSNLSDKHFERIVQQRLSPLYVSVHTTDDKLRRRMFRNEKLPPILPRLKYLTDNGIAVHAQVVLCPDINDGKAFEQTVSDLSSLYPGVRTLAVVPVGLTKYRTGLTKLRGYTPDEAEELIDRVESRQIAFFKALGSRFVWPADEFYVLAGGEFPRHHTYEEMSQFENGVGMVSEFVTSFNRRRSRLRGLNKRKRVQFLTGSSAHTFLSDLVMPYLRERLGLKASLHQVSNRFWGETVTVTGLLTGQDLLARAQAEKSKFDTVVLPPNCLNKDGLFLDDMSLEQFRSALGNEVVVSSYNLAATIREVYS